MTVFLKWNKSINLRLKTVYREIVQEELQDSPRENVGNTHFLVGSSKLTANKVNRITQQLELEGISDKVDFFLWKPPSDWTDKPQIGTTGVLNG